jgi:hypothetical protein
MEHGKKRDIEEFNFFKYKNRERLSFNGAKAGKAFNG